MKAIGLVLVLASVAMGGCDTARAASPLAAGPLRGAMAQQKVAAKGVHSSVRLVLNDHRVVSGRIVALQADAVMVKVKDRVEPVRVEYAEIAKLGRRHDVEWDALSPGPCSELVIPVVGLPIVLVRAMVGH